jgi:hypothetical protein
MGLVGDVYALDKMKRCYGGVSESSLQYGMGMGGWVGVASV